MATRGRFKGWKSAKAIAAMNPQERAEYDALVARVKAEREAEKIAKGIDIHAEEKKKEEIKARYEQKKENLQSVIASHLEYQKTHILSQEEDEENPGKPWYQEVNPSSGEFKETVINHLSNEGFCTIETNEDFWIRKILEMIEKTPDKVIIDEKFTNGEVIRIKIPYSCMKKIKTSVRVVSDEQRQRLSEMSKELNKKRRGRPRKNPIVAENETEVNTPTATENENTEENKDTTETTTETTIETTTEVTIENPSMDNTTTEETATESTVPEEETDEEFENTPMNRFREVEEDDSEEDDLEENITETTNEEDDDITF